MIHIGTCSWKYDSWRGLIYPEGERGDKLNYLQAYSQVLKSVEVDQWFWSLFGTDQVRLPKPEVVMEYAESVPDDFTFSIKVPNSITLTHSYRKDRGMPLKPNPHFLSESLFQQFLERLEPLQHHIGVLIFQFEYLNRQKISSQRSFHDQLSRFITACNRAYPMAVEIRNPNYLNSSYFAFLRDNGLSPVFMQGYYMPDIHELYRKFRQYIDDLTVIRLMGADRQKIEDATAGEWRRIVSPQDEDLERLFKMIAELNENQVEIYVNINNHYEGSAPLTIRKIHKHLESIGN